MVDSGYDVTAVAGGDNKVVCMTPSESFSSIFADEDVRALRFRHVNLKTCFREQTAYHFWMIRKLASQSYS